MREHNEAVNRLDFITGRAPITVDYEPGTVEMVEQHDGSTLALRKLDADYDVHDRLGGDELSAAACGQGPDRHRAASMWTAETHETCDRPSQRGASRAG